MNWIKFLLFLVPFIWSVGAVPWVNKVEPFVLGMPFLMFWELAGVFVGFLAIFAIYYIEHYLEKIS